MVETAGCWFVSLLALALAPRDWLPRQKRRVQVAALLLAAACPFTAVYVTTVLTEALALALGTVMAWCAARAVADGHEPAGKAPWRGRRWWLGAGLAGGALTLVRPEGAVVMAGIGLALVIITGWRLRRAGVGLGRAAVRVAAAGAMLTLGFLVFDGSWTLRNALVFGDFQPLNPRSLSMPGGYQFTGYNQWLRTWLNDPKYIGPFFFDLDRARISIDQLPNEAIGSSQERTIVSGLFALYNDGMPAPTATPPASDRPPAGLTPDLDQRFGLLARERIARYPIRYYVVLPVERLIGIWAGPHAQYYPFDGDLLPLTDLDTRTNQHNWLPLFALLVLLWTLFGVAGGAAMLAHPSARAALLLLLLVNLPRLALVGSMENPEPRYTVELFPFLSALGGVAMGWLWPQRNNSAADA